MKTQIACKTFGELFAEDNSVTKSYSTLEVLVLRMLKNIYSEKSDPNFVDPVSSINKIKKEVANLHPGCNCYFVPKVVMVYNDGAFYLGMSTKTPVIEGVEKLLIEAETRHFSVYGEMVESKT